MYAQFDGKLKVYFEGVNNIDISRTVADKRYFLKYYAATNTIDKGYLYLQGGENDVLNVTGGGNSTGLIHTYNKACLYILGGNINLEKTAGATYPVIYCHYARLQIKNCKLMIRIQ